VGPLLPIREPCPRAVPRCSPRCSRTRRELQTS
jgi:hypothetical protein